MKVVKDVEKWWGAGSLSNWLYIPKAHQNDIWVRFSDVKEQKNEALSYWIYKDPLASWRRLIVALERTGEFEKADSIRSNVEPLTGWLGYFSIEEKPVIRNNKLLDGVGFLGLCSENIKKFTQCPIPTIQWERVICLVLAYSVISYHAMKVFQTFFLFHFVHCSKGYSCRLCGKGGEGLESKPQCVILSSFLLDI